MMFLVLVITSLSATAQEKQLIVRVPGQTELQILRIGRQLACLEGVHFSGYAKGVSCLLLRYNTTAIHDETIITTMIHHLNHKLKFEVIQGMTAYDVLDGKLPVVKRTSNKKAR